MLIMTHPLPGSPSPVNTATNLSTLKVTTPAKIANVLDLIVGDSAPTTNDTPATDRVEIPLPDKFNQRKDELLGMLGGNYQFGGGNWGDNQQSDLLDDDGSNIFGGSSPIVGDSAPTTNDTPATDRVEIPLPDKFNQRKDELLGMLGGNYQFGGGNWGDNQQSDLLDDDGSNIFGGSSPIVGDSAPTTNDTPATDRVEIPLPDKFNQHKDELLGMLGGNYQFGGGNWDLDSVMDPSYAGGAGTDFAYELTKNMEQNNPAWLASAKAMLEQANQQPVLQLQLLQ